jgi:hypothetical protein
VLLNKGSEAQPIQVKMLNAGVWQDALSKKMVTILPEQQSLTLNIPAHSVKVLLLNKALSNTQLLTLLSE